MLVVKLDGWLTVEQLTADQQQILMHREGLLRAPGKILEALGVDSSFAPAPQNVASELEEHGD